jgi:hypothetical protein
MPRVNQMEQHRAEALHGLRHGARHNRARVRRSVRAARDHHQCWLRRQPAYGARGNIVDEFVLFGWVAKARRQTLFAYGAEIVRVHEIEIDKRLGDVPLNSLCVDPWLCDERLGEL